MMFGLYLKRLREEQKVSGGQLCRGLCTRQEIARLEEGQWEPDYFLREALLRRLGIGADDYECLLNDKEALQQEGRIEILEAILWNRRDEARERLEKYRQSYGEENVPDTVGSKLAMQFYLSMKGHLEKERVSREELYGIFRKAVDLTVPDYEEKPLRELVLSLTELNLILEAEQCRKGGARPECLLELVEYIEGKNLDGWGKAKIFPKVVYAFFCCIEKADSEALRDRTQTVHQPGTEGESLMWELCERSLKVLLDNGKMCYLWEILNMREKLLERKAERYARQENWMLADTEAMLEENRKWKDVLKEIYEEFDVSVETRDVCYLYIPNAFYSVNEVIRVRRQMLGLSRKELCQDICSVDTLRRLEENKTVPQRKIARDLLKRLGLPGEYTRTDLETDSRDVRELMLKLREKMNKGYWDDAEVLLKQMESMVDMEVPWNRQTIMNSYASISWKRKAIDNAQYCRLQREALELTMPFECFLREGEKFLTYEEQTCLQNMMQGMDKESQQFLICLKRFEEYYEPRMKKGIVKSINGMYELVMGMVGSKYGDRGEYDKSDMYTMPIIQGRLRLRKLWGIAHALYARWWNYEERRKRDIPDDRLLDGTKELTRCLVLCEMSGDRSKVLFCQKKLEQLKEKGKD